MKSQPHRSNKRKIHQRIVNWKSGFMLLIGLVLILVGIFAVNIVRASVSSSSAPGNPLAHQIVHIDMSTRAYPDLKGLTHAANLIVMGHVVGNGTTKRVAQPNTNPSGPDESLHETIFSFQVTHVFKGSVSINQHLSIFQRGGTFTERQSPGGPFIQRTYVVDDQPLLVPGNETLLFLDRATAGPDTGAYFIVGGQEGRYTVSQGQVHPFLSLTKHLIGHDGDTLSVFANAISDARK